MRKKEAWMFIGAFVMANGKRSTISKMQENKIDGIDYVYYVWVKYEGKKSSIGPFHPNDIKRLESLESEVSNA